MLFRIPSASEATTRTYVMSPLYCALFFGSPILLSRTEKLRKYG